MRALPLLLVALLAAASPAAAQAPVPSDAEGDVNPLAALNQEVKEALAAANVPFSPEQERAIALMMEERRRASEELFGDLMDFRSGPTRGEEEDRLRSAIEWMRREFLQALADYLTPEQSAAWAAVQASRAPVARAAAEPEPTQTQYVRINNNAFTSESIGFNGLQGTEVIQRGGIGAWHGNAQFLVKDDALNARNAFADNKPPYQERRFAADVSGPAIAGRLSSSFSTGHTESKNADTIRATLPDGVFALGITRPYTFRDLSTSQHLQLTTGNSVRGNLWFGWESSRDQGIGGFSLPERASSSNWHGWDSSINYFSVFSSRSLFEARLFVSRGNGETIPISESVRINVLDAFNAGGAQNRNESRNRNRNFSSRFTRAGGTVTIKTGLEGNYRVNRSISSNNFGGTFTFSSLDDYLAGDPITYRVNRGVPDLETRQLELSAYLQTDVEITSQLTLMVGGRYDTQTNIDDRHNFSPRAALAYAPGEATVIRGGGGIFYNRVGMGIVETQQRFDGTRQFEIVIDNPSYPDPFVAGVVRTTLPSVRVWDPDLVMPYFVIGMLSVERTLFSNLLLTATYDVQREYHKLRTRNLNTPFDVRAGGRVACDPATPDAACVKPEPARGNIISLESTGIDVKHSLRLSARKRFSIFNASASYQALRVRGDVQGGPGTLASNAWNVADDYGRSPQATQSVNASLNASLPLGVFLSGSVAYNSGRYYTITTGFDDNRDSNVNDRPPGVAFNTERGPRYLNVDLNLSKAFFLRRASGSTGGTNLNLFVNMTNALNHVHLGMPSGVMTSPNFRKITSASEPREIELGVRFQF